MKKLLYSILTLMICSQVMGKDTKPIKAAVIITTSDMEHHFILTNFEANLNQELIKVIPPNMLLHEFKKRIIRGEMSLPAATVAAIHTFAEPVKTYGEEFMLNNPSLVIQPSATQDNSYKYFFASFAPSTRIDNNYYMGNLLETTPTTGLSATEMWTCAVQSFNMEDCVTQTILQDKKNINKLARYSVDKLTQHAGDIGVLLLMNGFGACMSERDDRIIAADHLTATRLSNNPLAKQRIESLAGTTINSTSKTVNVDRLGGFTIDVNDYTYVADGFAGTYTFKVTRPTVTYGIVENFVLRRNDASQYDAFLYRYSLTQGDLDLINTGQPVPNFYNKLQVAHFSNVSSYSKEILPVGSILPVGVITYRNYYLTEVCNAYPIAIANPRLFKQVTTSETSTTAKVIHDGCWYCDRYDFDRLWIDRDDCFVIWNDIWPTLGGGDPQEIVPPPGMFPQPPGAGGGSINPVTIPDPPCIPAGGSFVVLPNTSMDNIEGGFDVFGGGTVRNPTVVPVNVPCVLPIPVENPCVSLNEMTRNPISLNALKALETKTDLTAEKGYALQKDPLTESINMSPELGAIPNYPNMIDVTPYIGGSTIGIFHTHPDYKATTIAPMFSRGDVNTLFKLANGGASKNPSEYVVTMTVKNGYDENKTFAIKIKNINFFKMMRNDVEKWAQFERELNDNFVHSGDHAGVEESLTDFLQALDETGMKDAISIYEANDDFSNWSELSFDSQSNLTTPIPCN